MRMVETVYVHDTLTQTVYDTVRETTTVQLNAEGDTTRRDTEREHISDRRERQRNESVRETEQERSHTEESDSQERLREVVQEKRNPVKPFLCGVGAGLIMATIIFVGSRKWFKR